MANEPDNISGNELNNILNNIENNTQTNTQTNAQTNIETNTRTEDLSDRILNVCRSEQTYIIRPEHMNSQARLFGGQLMMWIDEVAGIAARRYCKCNITTAGVDGLDFIDAAHFNDTLHLIAGVTYVGNTSMEITVHTYTEKIDGTRKLINVAHLVEVALDKNEHPVKVPQFIPATSEEREAFEKGRIRNQLRKNRRKAGL